MTLLKDERTNAVINHNNHVNEQGFDTDLYSIAFRNSNNLDIFKLLLEDGRFDPNFFFQELLDLAEKSKNRVDKNIINSLLMLIETGRVELAVLNNYPRVKSWKSIQLLLNK